MKFLAFLLTMSVGLGCAATRGRSANSPDDEDNEEVTDSQGEDSDDQADDDNDDARETREAPRPARKRKPTRPRHVEAAPQPELPPMYRKPLPPPPVEPPPEEPAPAPAALTETADQQGDGSLEAEARKRCHWKKVAPYRPEWANSLSPPLSRKITSKPICSYGTPPAVLHAARQIAVQQTKLKPR